MQCESRDNKRGIIVEARNAKVHEEFGFPVKALACIGERAPKELSETTTINVAGYKWEPHTDKMMIVTPKIFIGEKKERKIHRGNHIL